MKTYLAVILVLLSIVLYGALAHKRPGGRDTNGKVSVSPVDRTSDSKQKIEEHLTRQSDKKRQERVDLDARLADGARRTTDEQRISAIKTILERTRETRRSTLLGWGLTEAEISRVEEIQSGHWLMQNQDSDKNFIERPAAIGDRSDPERVAAYESKVRKSASASEQVFRMELLATLGSSEKVDAYMALEEKFSEEAEKDSIRRLEEAMGKKFTSRDD